MGGDDHALTAFDAWQDFSVPVRDNAIDGQRQAFGQWQFAFGQRCVTRVMARVALVVLGQFWWRYREAATPLLNLLVTVFSAVSALFRPCNAP